MLNVIKITEWEVYISESGLYIMCTNVMNVCDECRLYESWIIITRISDRRPSHNIDCTRMLEYVVW
ncbi:hypothetical protein Hanom_Chr05g00399711 [Helianthus anomalus]